MTYCRTMVRPFGHDNELDEAVCEQARLTHDARFDGRLFIGIASTGIYCRPICPSRRAKRRNVSCFLSAAAAVKAGFRPCLRCRLWHTPQGFEGTSTR